MNKNTTIGPENITDDKFISRWQELKPVLMGRSRQVADCAGVDITRFTNATQGRIKSPELLWPMYEAMEEVARKVIQNVEL